MVTHSKNTGVGFSPWMGLWATLSPSRTLDIPCQHCLGSSGCDLCPQPGCSQAPDCPLTQ